MPDRILQETIAEFGPLLLAAGWKIAIHAAADAIRIDGSLGDAAVMVTHKAFRSRGRRLYVLCAPGLGPVGWRDVKRVVFEDFLDHPHLPPGTKVHVPRSPCRCGKVRYATERRAGLALLDLRERRALTGERPECRAYRCDDDQRAWHLTRKPAWRTAGVSA